MGTPTTLSALRERHASRRVYLQTPLPALLLEVARLLPQPFSYGELVVAVWKRHPDRFSLVGHPFPDSHKVSGLLYGYRGVIRKKKLVKVVGGFRMGGAA